MSRSFERGYMHIVECVYTCRFYITWICVDFGAGVCGFFFFSIYMLKDCCVFMGMCSPCECVC